MNINRNNYEEYFLLYADKELSADEKNMVEMFVQQNPDLEEEFVMLQQSVIKPDNTITIDKSSLFRKEAGQQEQYINQSNYQEKFLLYADNELSLPEIEETEKFVLANPSLQNEFTLLQNVKYEADTSIVFPDKRLLYKKEDDAKVIPFRWKAMAAAALLGAGLWTGISYLQKESTQPPVATNRDAKPKDTLVKPEPNVDNKNMVTTETTQDQPLQSTAPKALDNTVKKQQENVTVKTIQAPGKPQEIKAPEQKNEDVAVNLPEKSTVRPGNDEKPIFKTTELPDKTIVTASASENNNYAQPTSYLMEEEVKSENYVFYNITAEEFRKSKVGNFLKKVKRAVERKLPFKNSGLKIGNVEIERDIQN